jgi:hypothetical protein
MPYARCPMPDALCPMPDALCQIELQAAESRSQKLQLQKFEIKSVLCRLASNPRQ